MRALAHFAWVPFFSLFGACAKWRVCLRVCLFHAFCVSALGLVVLLQVLYTRAAATPEAVKARCAKACEKAGLDFNQFVFSDNSCKVLPLGRAVCGGLERRGLFTHAFLPNASFVLASVHLVSSLPSAA